MNRITQIFGIKYPIIQGGMIWCSGWELASAVSNAGGLGLIGAGSMTPDILRHHIRKTKEATSKPFGVNIPLLYSETEKMIKIIMEERVPVVFSSAGNPKTWTKILQDEGIKVAHVTANTKFAIKSEQAGVDAIVAEGFEAGGHNGREETTTLTLIQAVKKSISKPLIAAGGISSGKAMLACMILGAEGVQIGSRFVASKESSAHDNFKRKIIEAKEGDTYFAMKKLVPVRLLRNEFAKEIENAEAEGKTKQELSEKLGRGRAKAGMFEGNISEGELEIGQVSAIIDEIKSCSEIINEIINDYQSAIQEISNINFL